MSLLALYRRVLESLGSDKRLAWTLALANVALVLAQFAEPVLFGRIIDRLSATNASQNRVELWDSVWPYLLAWILFGLFTIGCGALIALQADRLAHRRRHVMLRRYFEHVLQLPLSHHAQVHSGRLMKIMLQGTDALWTLWLGFFREHLAAFAALGAAGGLGVMRYFSGENGFFAAEPASYALFVVPGVVTALGGRIGMRAWAKRLRAG